MDWTSPSAYIGTSGGLAAPKPSAGTAAPGPAHRPLYENRSLAEQRLIDCTIYNLLADMASADPSPRASTIQTIVEQESKPSPISRVMFLREYVTAAFCSGSDLCNWRGDVTKQRTLVEETQRLRARPSQGLPRFNLPGYERFLTNLPDAPRKGRF